MQTPCSSLALDRPKAAPVVPAISLWLLVILHTVLFISRTDAGTTPPLNRLLGTCLDAEWVAQMESELQLSSQARDSIGRLRYPFLQPALKAPRYQVDDVRTASPTAYSDDCTPDGGTFYGVGGNGTSQGRVNGTLVLDTGGWDSNVLSMMVLAIIAQEVVGYEVSIYKGDATSRVTQRMSSARSGICTPTHVNVEVWPANLMSLQAYANESYIAGSVGYAGIAGVYTTHDFVLEGANESLYSPPIFPAYWMQYRSSDDLINTLSVEAFKTSSGYYPPQETFCSDGSLGCQAHCSRSYACTLRKETGMECLVMVFMQPKYDQGYFQAVLSNLNIPVYFCFLGDTGTEDYVLEAQQKGIPVLFYHFEPDLFHVKHAGLFDRVFLPRSDPFHVLLATGGYGENGYGNKTDNPVDVDYPQTQLMKYAAVLVEYLPIGSTISKLSISDLAINNLLEEYNIALGDATETDPHFRAACNWIKSNYSVWSTWLDRLPLCTIDTSVNYSVIGCENDSYVRQIEFQWVDPNPANSSLPYKCDGGLVDLPSAFTTSRSCDWINENVRIWQSWIDSKPACDPNFFRYNVSDCDSSGLRTITYFWLLPRAGNTTLSSECEGGYSLPDPVRINCDYLPTSSPYFVMIVAFAVLVAVLLLAAIFFVYMQRNAPKFCATQPEMLVLMLVGGLFICGATIAYTGRPTTALCGLRPVLVSTGFTTTFGALMVKCLRVYRVLMRYNLKSVKMARRKILQLFATFYLGDILLFAYWFINDFPKPTIITDDSSAFRGVVDQILCKSSSPVFTALLLFWKAVLLCVGLYLSFQIRNVSEEFQEAHWIFGSALVLLVVSVVMLPLSYLVDLPAVTYTVFFAGVLLLCTVLIMALMLLPKLVRVKEPEVQSAVRSSRSSFTIPRPSFLARYNQVAVETSDTSNIE